MPNALPRTVLEEYDILGRRALQSLLQTSMNMFATILGHECPSSLGKSSFGTSRYLERNRYEQWLLISVGVGNATHHHRLISSFSILLFDFDSFQCPSKYSLSLNPPNSLLSCAHTSNFPVRHEDDHSSFAHDAISHHSLICQATDQNIRDPAWICMTVEGMIAAYTQFLDPKAVVGDDRNAESACDDDGDDASNLWLCGLI